MLKNFSRLLPQSSAKNSSSVPNKENEEERKAAEQKELFELSQVEIPQLLEKLGLAQEDFSAGFATKQVEPLSDWFPVTKDALPERMQHFSEKGRVKRVEYDNIIVTAYVQAAQPEAKDVLSRNPVATIFVEQKNEVKEGDVSSVCISLVKVPEFITPGTSEEKVAKFKNETNIAYHIKGKEGQRGTRFVWYESYKIKHALGQHSADPTLDEHAENETAPAEIKGETGAPVRVIRRLKAMVRQETMANMTLSGTMANTMSNTLLPGAPSILSHYHLRFKEAPLEVASLVTNSIIKNEPLQDFTDDDVIAQALSLLKDRAEKFRQNPTLVWLADTISKHVPKWYIERVDVPATANILGTLLEDFNVISHLQPILGNLSWDQIFAGWAGVPNGPSLGWTQWARFERFRNGIKSTATSKGRTIEVGAASHQILPLETFKTNSASIECTIHDSPSPIRSIQFFEEEWLGMGLRVVIIHVLYPGLYRGELTLIRGSDGKDYDNLRLYSPPNSPAHDSHRAYQSFEVIPEQIVALAPRLIKDLTYANARIRAANAIGLIMYPADPLILASTTNSLDEAMPLELQ